MTRTDGSDNDASADNLSLLLSAPSITPTPTTSAVSFAPQVFVSYIHRNGHRAIFGNQLLTVTALAAPRSPVTFSVSLTSRAPGASAPLFSRTVTAVADATGVCTGHLKITYSPPKPAYAVLVVSASTRAGTDMQRLGVVLYPS
jgi:hypothetical protein